MPASPFARPATRRLAAAVALLAVGAAPAEAQLLKRVKQMAPDKAAQVGAGAAGDRADAGAADAAPATKAPMPITAERLELFLVAMRPAAARAERGRAAFEARKAYDAARTAVEAHNRKVEACGARVMEQERPRLMRLAANPVANGDVLLRLQGYDPRLGPLSEAAIEATARGDHARAKVLGDSAIVIKYRAIAGVVPALGSCGLPKSEPAEPTQAEETTPEQLIAPPAGMTRGQFGRLRERVAVYALTGGKDDPFTAEERSALGARAADLAKLAPLFRDGLLEWGQWGSESELGKAWNARAAGS